MDNIKIGRITLAFTFIALGVIIFLDKFMSFSLKDSFFIFWPIIIIVLGIEIIVGSFINKKQESKNNLDIFSISVIIIIVAVIGTLDLGSKLQGPSYKYSQTISEQIEIDEDKKLIIDESDIDIEVIKSSDEKIRVKLEGRYNHDEDISDKKLLSVEKTEEATRVKRLDRQQNVHFMNINSGDMKCIVELPSGIEIDIISEYGDIDVVDIKSNLDIKSNTADIEIKNIIGDVSVINSYGDILGEEILGDINIIATTGDVTLQLSQMKNVDIEAEYGDVSVRLPSNQTGKFNVVTSYGDIFDELGFDIIESASTSSIHETRSALTPVFDIRVETGDVTLETN